MMSDKSDRRIILNSNKLSSGAIILLLFLVSLFVRLPFFFRDYIDRDESTFILIGQSWVDGHLPYTELWDVKPPITFLFFAAVIYVFGKSFVAIRFFGTLLIAVSAFFTYKISGNLVDKKTAFWSAMACVALQSMFGSVQGVMSEHIGMAFFMPGLYLLIKATNRFYYFFAGLLLGLSLMVKLNMAYAILFLGLYLVYAHFKKKEYGQGIQYSILFGTGILLVVLLTILPYYLEDIVSLWWKSVVTAPLDYAAARRYSLLKLAPTFLLVGGFLIFASRKKYIKMKRTAMLMVVLTILGVLLSFLKGGRINSHYLIQLYPLLVIPVGITVARLSIFQKIKYRFYVGMILFLLPVESYLEYYAIIKNKMESGTFYNGEGFTVSNFLEKNDMDTSNILFLGYHIGYWVLDRKPPTKAATHPSNICKDEMFKAYENPRKTSLEELRYIMDTIRPKIVIVRKNRLIFDKKEIEENTYIDAYLKKKYHVAATVDQAEILRRLE